MRQTTLRCPAEQAPWTEAIGILRLLISSGYDAFLVGGCVRDLLLGRQVKDIDLATNAHPEQVEACCVAAGLRCIAVGRSFGVIVVVTASGANVEVATFRHDGAYIDGRKPTTITFSTAEEDVWRRDFTINALLYDPQQETVIDYVAGLEDVRNRLLRAVGDAAARLREDRLRILRGIRFAAHLGLTIDPATWQAICTTTLDGLSTERLVQEWGKGLQGPRRSAWLALLHASGHLGGLCAPLAVLDMHAVEVLGRSLDRLPGDASLAALAAAWLAPAKDPCIAWLKRLPVALATRISWLLEQLRDLPGLVASRPPRQRRVLQHAAASELVALAQALALTPSQEAQAQALATAVRREQEAGPWIRLIGAKDLMPLGISSGPGLGDLIRQLEDAQLEGVFQDREAGLALARELLAHQRSEGRKDPP